MEAWLTHVIEERVELEEAAFTGARQELAKHGRGEASRLHWPVPCSTPYFYELGDLNSENCAARSRQKGVILHTVQRGVAAGSAQTTYDAVGRATGLNAWDPVNLVWNPMTSGATYNAAGQITGWQEGAVALTRGYDAARGWMTTLTASAGYPYNQTYLNMQYGYNADGQATSVTDSVNSGQAVTSYTYDNLNRLASATTPNWSMSWTYDEFGNRTSETGTGTAASLTSSLSYDQSTNRITTSGYGYDSNGNLTASPGKTYAYDAFDRLVSGSYGAGNSYDAFGRRIARTLSDGSTQFYFYDTGGKLIQEYHFDPNVQCSVYGNLVPCPTLDGTPPVYTYFAGQRVGQLTDRTGSKLRDASSTSHYYPYGE